MKYDLVIIGGGPGGYNAAFEASKHNLRVAIIEKNKLGGTCLHQGCIPTKSLLHSADVYYLATHSNNLGITTKNVELSISQMYRYKNEIVNKLYDGLCMSIKQKKIEVINGAGKIVSQNKVLVGETEIETENIIIATGSVPIKPNIPGINFPNVLTSDDVLKNNDTLYKNIVIIGGGVIGLEFATFYNFLGVDVTIIEAAEKLIPSFDADISRMITTIMKKRGINIITNARVKKIDAHEKFLSCHYEINNDIKNVSSEIILVAVGRKAFFDEICTDDIKLETQNGKIKTDSNFMTNIKNIYAIGDVTSDIQLAHAASSQAITVVNHIIGKKSSMSKIIPSCIYTSPEIASVGMTFDEAIENGIDAGAKKIMMGKNARSLIESKEYGFIKIIYEKNSHVILGAQIVCARATDLISELSLAIANKMTLEQIKNSVHPHPTFSESIFETANL